MYARKQLPSVCVYIYKSTYYLTKSNYSSNFKNGSAQLTDGLEDEHCNDFSKLVH